MEKSIKHLLNLIKDNPDLPVKIMVNGQALADGKTADGRTIYYEAEIGDSEIREFALNTWSSAGNGEILFRGYYIQSDCISLRFLQTEGNIRLENIIRRRVFPAC